MAMAALAGAAYARMQIGSAMTQGSRNEENATGKTGAQNGLAPAYMLDLAKKSDKTNPEIQRLKRSGKIECQTCKERTYQDGSNDPGVSFKAPGHISPESSGAVVMSHEQEHVGNEQAKASKEGSRVVSQSVRIFSSVCPECGKVYVSGGETRTTTATDPKPQKAEAALGKKLDIKA